MRVLKFGGTSVATAERLAQVASIVARAAARERVVVVVSALGGVTNELLAAARQAAAHDDGWRSRLVALRDRHLEAAAGVAADAAERERLGAVVEVVFGELAELLHGAFLLRETTPRAVDRVASVGERLAAPLAAAALRAAGVAAEAVDARELLVSDRRFGAARVDRAASDPRVRAFFAGPPWVAAAASPPGGGASSTAWVPVVTGFVAATPEGETTTLGRGGSDLTAALLGAALGADEIEIWTDVPGVLSADPRVVPSAFSLPELTYEELMELSHFGAKVVYPPTVHPARAAGIPLRILDTFHPDHPGTRVSERAEGRSAASGAGDVAVGDGPSGAGRSGDGEVAGGDAAAGVARAKAAGAGGAASAAPTVAAPTSGAAAARFAGTPEPPVRGLASIRRVALLRLQGDGMVGVPGIAARLFGALARQSINVILITQASSEHSISLAVQPEDLARAVEAVEEEFRLERTAELVDALAVEPELAVVAAVGDGMRERPGVAGQIFAVLGRERINVRAIAQGSSERNISLVVRGDDETRALRALHAELFPPVGQAVGQAVGLPDADPVAGADEPAGAGSTPPSGAANGAVAWPLPGASPAGVGDGGLGAGEPAAAAAVAAPGTATAGSAPPTVDVYVAGRGGVGGELLALLTGPASGQLADRLAGQPAGQVADRPGGRAAAEGAPWLRVVGLARRDQLWLAAPAVRGGSRAVGAVGGAVGRAGGGAGEIDSAEVDSAGAGAAVGGAGETGAVGTGAILAGAASPSPDEPGARAAERFATPLPGGASSPLAALVAAAVAAPGPRVFVDVTASDATTPYLPSLLAAGCAVVAANKRPFAGSLDDWRAIQAGRARGARRLGVSDDRPLLGLSTTVGAGLPFVSVVEALARAGDRPWRLEAVLSGTISFLFARLAAGEPFSAALAAAAAAGYTEPDPRDDLGGLDVARKLVILARAAGVELQPEEVVPTSLLPAEPWSTLPLAELWRRLPELDDTFAASRADALARGLLPAYLARLELVGGNGAPLVAPLATVGPCEVPLAHPLAGLPPGENLLVITTARYRSAPLVIRGPGAGPRLTAAGVLADLELAAQALVAAPGGMDSLSGGLSGGPLARQVDGQEDGQSGPVGGESPCGPAA